MNKDRKHLVVKWDCHVVWMIHAIVVRIVLVFVYMKSKKPKKPKNHRKMTQKKVILIHVIYVYICMWHCGLCPDGVDTSGCCGGCVYRSTEDGLQCLYEGTWSECFAAKAVIQPVIEPVKSIGNKYIEMKQKHFVWLCVILGLLIG
eukprot:559658_1